MYEWYKSNQPISSFFSHLHDLVHTCQFEILFSMKVFKIKISMANAQLANTKHEIYELSTDQHVLYNSFVSF
jgi:hypothetical protein